SKSEFGQRLAMPHDSADRARREAARSLSCQSWERAADSLRLTMPGSRYDNLTTRGSRRVFARRRAEMSDLIAYPTRTPEKKRLVACNSITWIPEGPT